MSAPLPAITVTLVVPPGYRTGEEFAADCGFEIAVPAPSAGSPASAITDPAAWIDFADNGNIRFWTNYAERAASEKRRGRHLRMFTLAELVALASKSAPALCGSLPSGESDPAVMLDHAGADTHQSSTANTVVPIASTLDQAAALVLRFEHESMALHKTQRDWLVREIAALSAAPVSAWQDISTAPKDRAITGHAPGWRTGREVSWAQDHWECAFAGTMAVHPTLWQPLPAGPISRNERQTEAG